MKGKSKNILKWVWFGALGAVVLLVIGDAIFTNTPIGVQLFSGSGGKTVESAKEALKKPEIITITEKETEIIPHGSETVDDNILQSGKTVVRVAGVDGERVKVYSVTYTNGIETARELVSEKVVKEPVTEIIANGTYVYIPPQQTTSAQNCPNGSYINTAGNEVCRPSTTQVSGATAICRDGTYSYSQSRRGTCSHHGGVAQWL